MVRAILGVIVGYIVMAVLVMAVFAGLLFGLELDRIYEPQTFQATMLFCLLTLLASFLCAIMGGRVCRWIAKTATPVMVFAAIVLALGLIMGVSNMNKPDPGTRKPDMQLLDVVKNGREPTWYGFTAPFVGAVGVLIGGKAFSKKK